jgi:hypothetical protein
MSRWGRDESVVGLEHPASSEDSLQSRNADQIGDRDRKIESEVIRRIWTGHVVGMKLHSIPRRPVDCDPRYGCRRIPGSDFRQ